MAYERRRGEQSSSSRSFNHSSTQRQPRRRLRSRPRRSSVSSTRKVSQPLGRISFPPSTARRTNISSHTYESDFTDPHIEDDAEIDAREAQDGVNETIMAIDIRDRSVIGCAYYVARAEKLYVMGDVGRGRLDIIDSLKIHVQPTDILINMRADDALEEHLKSDARHIDKGEDANDVYGSYILRPRPSSEFKVENARNKLVDLDISAEAQMGTVLLTASDRLDKSPDKDLEGVSRRQGQLIMLGGYIDMSSVVSIGCAGAILAYLSKRRHIDFMPGDQDALLAFQVRAIEQFSLSDIMFINGDTLSSLQILQSEAHPNSQMQGPVTSGAKESLSVFGLFRGLAKTSQGKQKLRQIFLRPSTDLNSIRARHDTITVLLHPANAAPLEYVIKAFRNIKDMHGVIIHLQKGTTKSKGASFKNGIWGSLQGFAFGVLKILEGVAEFQSHNTTPDIFTRLLTQIDAKRLREIGRWITETVDFEGSTEQHRTTVLQGVDGELDKMKQQYHGMDSLLTRVATEISNELPEWARQYIENCIFFPQLGFLTVVAIDPTTGKSRYEGEGVEDDHWEKSFVSNDMGYFKNNRMREMDAYFGDVWAQICDREIEIVHDLAVKLLVFKELLLKASDLCGELDSLVALSMGARRYDLVPPRMTTSNVLDITGGRHILQELTVPSFVPNDCHLVGGQGDGISDGEIDNESLDRLDQTRNTRSDVIRQNMLLMTGPNYSGKSVYLKQNALIVYLAHIGSFVPAEKAIIGLTDKILTRIVTRESVSRNQSAFMIDLQQIAYSITQSTRRSLIIIDEFGKGTNSIDGAGLAAGVFKYFLTLSEQAPRVLAATHFHEILGNGILEDIPQLALGHMEVYVDSNTDVPQDQLTYLYNFKPGLIMSSFGTMCALLNGVDEAVVNRAGELVLLVARGEDLVAACSTTQPEKLEELQHAEAMGRRLLAADFDADDVNTSSILHSIVSNGP